MSLEDNRKLVQQVYADSASRSGTTFAEDLAEDACWIVTGQYSWSHQFKGRDAIKNGLMGHFRSFFAERPRTAAFNFIAEGDYVVVEARGDNVTKAGLRYDNQYCMVWRIEGGKIKEIKEYGDSRWSSACSGHFRRSASSRLRFETRERLLRGEFLRPRQKKVVMRHVQPR